MSAGSAVHPVAAAILADIRIKEPGSESFIPPDRLAAIERSLRRDHRDEREIFVHLVVLFARLNRGGLTTAAEQLLVLAQLGLQASELKQTLEQLGEIERAKKIVAEPEKTTAAAKAFAGASKTSLDDVTREVTRNGKNPGALATLLCGLGSQELRKAALAAMRAHRPKPVMLAQVVAAAPEDARSDLTTMFAEGCTRDEKLALVRALAKAGSPADDTAILFVLQFAGGKDVEALARAAGEAGSSLERLMALAEDARASDGRELGQVLAALNA